LIQGTIESTGITSVLQIPSLSNASGKLAVTNGGDRGEVYYRNGKVVHAELGDLVGADAVIRMMRWDRGQFEFNDQDINGVPTSIEVDLQYIILEAIRIIDEEKAAEGRQESAEAPEADDEDLLSRLGDSIREMMESSKVAVDAVGVLNEEGRLALFFGSSGLREQLEELSAASVEFVGRIMEVRGANAFASAIFADSVGCILVQTIRPGLALIAITKVEASIGALKLQVNKISRAFSD
jgi:Domain of unknown function (DUF4388)